MGGDWVYNEEFQREEWVGSEEPRETDNPTGHCMDIFAIATTESEPANPQQFWQRKMQQVKCWLSEKGASGLSSTPALPMRKSSRASRHGVSAGTMPLQRKRLRQQPAMNNSF